MADSSEPTRRGRPRMQAAESHAVIMDAVYALLQEKSVRDLTMEEVAKRAKVGKPTLYKWWPTKAALVMTLFHERIARRPEPLGAVTGERAIRGRVRLLIGAFNGFFGKVMADLIAEGQSEPVVLRELYEQHVRQRRAEAVAEVERGKVAGELRADTDPELVIDAVFGAIYYRLLLRSAPLTEQYGEELVDQVFRGLRSQPAGGR